MRPWSIFAAFGLIISAGRSSLAAEVQLGSHLFTVPDGFEVELVAGPPLVLRPIVAELDDDGHLYVADSAGVNQRPEMLLAEKPHRILRLTDSDGDGRFDESKIFADRLTFPEGAMWHRGALYVASPPDILKLEDTDGDGVADRRSVWLTGFPLNGKG